MCRLPRLVWRIDRPLPMKHWSNSGGIGVVTSASSRTGASGNRIPKGQSRSVLCAAAQSATRGAWISPYGVLTPFTRPPAVRTSSTGEGLRCSLRVGMPGPWRVDAAEAAFREARNHLPERLAINELERDIGLFERLVELFQFGELSLIYRSPNASFLGPLGRVTEFLI